MLYSKAWDSLMCPLASLRAGPFDSAQGRLCGSEEKIILFSLPAVETAGYFQSSRRAGLAALRLRLRAEPAAARKNLLIDIFSRP